jgi:hypothetical protein
LAARAGRKGMNCCRTNIFYCRDAESSSFVPLRRRGCDRDGRCCGGDADLEYIGRRRADVAANDDDGCGPDGFGGNGGRNSSISSTSVKA